MSEHEGDGRKSNPGAPHDPWDDEKPRRDGLSDLASRFIRAGAEAVVTTGGRLMEAGEDFRPRDVLAGAAKGAAKGKDELVTLVAKEVRSYLEKLELGKEISDFARGHELEVHATFRLKNVQPKDTPPAG